MPSPYPSRPLQNVGIPSSFHRPLSGRNPGVEAAAFKMLPHDVGQTVSEMTSAPPQFLAGSESPQPITFNASLGSYGVMGNEEPRPNPLLEEADVFCPACSREIAVRPHSYPLAFHCAGGHSLTLEDLLNDSLLRGEKAAASAFELWPQKVILLRRLAGRVLRLGNTLVAADLQESANRIDQWVSSLRVLLSKESVSMSVDIAGEESGRRSRSAR
jgi:hypothetical protein